MKTSALAGQKIIELRKCLNFSQKELAARLGASTMSISRWERDALQPSGSMLIKLGNLAAATPAGCWDFWEQTGHTIQDVSRVVPTAAANLRRTLTVLQVVKAGARHQLSEDSLVAIPMSTLVASAGKQDGSPSHELESSVSRHAIVAPKLWCPNPANSICVQVKGNSMEPLLHNSYIIVVDQKQNDRKKLNGKIIVAHHKKFGLVVSRFWNLAGTESLIPDNRQHSPVNWTSAWQVTGRVLWWIGQST